MTRALLALALLLSACDVPLGPECVAAPAARAKCGSPAAQPADPPDAAIGHTGILLVGDSLTANWTAGHWPAGTVNHGKGGTQACAWERSARIYGGYNPSTIYLMLGTNDGGTPAEVWACIQAVIAQLLVEYPRAHVVLIPTIGVGASLPQCGTSNTQMDGLRALEIASGYHTTGTAVWDALSCTETCSGVSRKVLCAAYTSDGIHLTAAGYNAFAAALGLP